LYETLSLFDEPGPELKRQLGPSLRALASNSLFLGTSSWKYTEWLGQIYSPSRYHVRGRFSRKHFNETCLSEYAETFPVVSGDFSFYQFPDAQSWCALFKQAAAPFQFAFKVPEEITLATFPNHYRYGLRAGQVNPSFLSVELLRTQFLNPLLPYADRVALLLFEFATSAERNFSVPEDFADVLSRFFGALPNTFRYGVEVRHPRFFQTSYFRALKENGIAHIFNSWSDMPGIAEQMENTEAFTADFTGARALVRPGRTYEESVRLFSPYVAVQESNSEVREALRSLLVRAKCRAEPAYVFVNNRLEGFAPGTIGGVIERI